MSDNKLLVGVIILIILGLSPITYDIYKDECLANDLKKLAQSMRKDKVDVRTATTFAFRGDHICIRMRSKDYWEGYIYSADEERIKILLVRRKEVATVNIVKSEIEAEIINSEY